MPKPGVHDFPGQVHSWGYLAVHHGRSVGAGPVQEVDESVGCKDQGEAMSKLSYLDDNGLVNGDIPKGKACPFLNKCGFKVERCPTKENPKNCDYSCAAARAWSLCAQVPSGTMQGIIQKKDD